MPRVRVKKDTLRKIIELQGYLQMASGERMTQDETILYAVQSIPKIVQTEGAKGKIQTWVLELKRRREGEE